MDEQDELKPQIKQAEDLSRQRQGLRNRAYSEEGKRERLEARLNIFIKPTIARLKLIHTNLHSRGEFSFAGTGLVPVQ